MPISELVLVVMGLLSIAMFAASVGRTLPIPYTVFLVLIGMVLATLADRVPALAPLGEFKLTPDLVFFIFLPALIFESALNLDARQLMKDIAPIFVLAAPALVISTGVIGFGLWGYMDLDLTLALLFGALISATDPVAVVALFKELGAPARLTTLVEGESLFNDATAIVLFHILLGIALAGTFTSGDLQHAVFEFFYVFFGGVVCGGLIGLGIAALMRRIRGSDTAILVMSLVMAYASFVLAEHLLHVSGVMAAVSAAIAMGFYGVTRISQSALRSIRETWEIIALVCNSLLFLMIGLSVDLGVLVGNLDGILLAAILVLVARAAVVYTLVPGTVRLFSLPTVDMGERHIMWWGGLKGGLAIAIVLSIPEALHGRQTLVELTLGVVLLTLLVNAPSIRPLMSRLGIDRMSEEETSELRRGLLEARQQAGDVVERLAHATRISPNRRAALVDAIGAAFDQDAPAGDPKRHLRHVYMEALRLELAELESLYDLGLVSEYTYLDLRALLRRDRESWASAPADGMALVDAVSANPFLRLEQFLVRALRERNSLAWFLARVQTARLNQGIQRDIAGILCGEAVVAKLPARVGLEPEDVAAVIELYEKRIQRKRERLDTMRKDFPAFFASLEDQLTQTAALTSARHYAKRSHHDGDIGAKAYAQIERRLDHAIEAVPPLTIPDDHLSAAELIERVPLFAGLSPAAIDKLSRHAQQITFLSGDVVIGQNERGNALYILMRGSVEVFRDDGDGNRHIAALAAGEFFGERALLADESRSATVRAATPLTLLRLTRRAVETLATEYSEIAQRLRQVDTSRT